MFGLPRKSRPSIRNTPSPRPNRPGVEQLEIRDLLATSLLAPAAGAILNPAAARPDVKAFSVTNPAAAPLTPLVLRAAYGVNLLQFQSGGNFVTGNGAGQTIAIIDAYNDPTIVADLATFSSTFSLPNAPSFTVLNENGGTNLSGIPNAPHSSWAIEESLDVEWAHTIAPAANIVLFEGNSSSFSDLGTGVLSAANPATYSALGIPAAGVISNSYGATESRLNLATEQFFDSTYYQPTSSAVSLVFSAGDNGVQNYPSTSPYVLSVGGTKVTVTATPFGAKYKSEVAWSPDPGSTGGGTSAFEPIPSYQVGYPNISGAFRQTPDISWDADPASGVYITDTYDFPGDLAVGSVGGTSLAAPLWAGLLADVNQGRALNGQGVLLNANAAVYSVPSSDFHDITSGHNNVATAGPGYDEVTGIGSPIANKLVPALVSVGGAPAVVVPSSGSGNGPVISAVASNDTVVTTNGTLVPATASVAVSLSPAASMARDLTVTPVTVAAPSTGQVVRTDAAATVTALPTATASTLERFHGNSDAAPLVNSDATPADLVLPNGPADGVTPVADPATPAGDVSAVLPATLAGTASDVVFADYAAMPASAAAAATPAGVLAGEETHSIDLALAAGMVLALGGSWSAAARAEENRKHPALRS
jgi:subtilase family serine protease